MALSAALYSSSSVAFILVSLALSYIIVGSIVNYRKLPQFPGPRTTGFSKAWLFWQEVNARTHTATAEAIRRYGSVCRIGPNLLITDDIDIVRHMSAHGSGWTRGTWYDGVKLDPRQDSVFSTRDEQLHTDLRAKETGAYNGRDIDNLESDIDARVLDLINLIKTSYNGVSLDISDILQFFTLDSLGTIAFGAPFGFMAENRDIYKYKETLSPFFAITVLAAAHPLIRRLFMNPFMVWLAYPKPTDKKGLGPVIAFGREAVKERFGPNRKAKRDMLGAFVDKGLSQIQCESEAMLQIIAGSDTTLTALRSTIFLTIGSPVVYSKLRDEIDSAVQEGTLSDRIIDFDKAERLPYLSACIWETLRMYPPGLGLKWKLAPKGGDTIRGHYFPEGTEISTCELAWCRSIDTFGPDANLFRPERWTEAGEKARQRYRYIVDANFATGRHTCLGKHVAFMELYKVTAELIRRFDWAMTDPLRGIDMHAHGVWLQSNMNLIARPRT